MKSYRKKQKEGFTNSIFSSIVGSIHFIFFIFAIYVSFKCNDSFSFLSFISAFCCPECYLLFIAVTKGINFCVF